MVVVASLAIAALLTSGCSIGAPGPKTSAAGGTASPPVSKASASASNKMSGMSKGGKGAAEMVCAVCSGGGTVGPVKGEPVVDNGTQVVTIYLKNGRYTPTAFSLQTGMPVKVNFVGTASGCLGHPTFKSLGKAADVTKGPASLDLGTLASGSYKFSCSMGMNAGTITVQ